jgi:hypothetical protein
MVRRTQALVGALLLLTVGLVPAAQAESLARVDDRGDVFRISSTGQWVPAEGETVGDIWRLRIRHSVHAVSVRVRFADLRRDTFEMGIRMRLRSNEGVWRQAALLAGSDLPTSGHQEFEGRNRVGIRCGVTHRIDYADNFMRLRMPRRCFGQPRWVQATLFSEFDAGDGARGDNALADTAPLWGRPWSPRIRRD